MMRRRTLLTAAAAAPLWAGCERTDAPAFDGGWVGANAVRGHAWRDGAERITPSTTKRTAVAIVGAGIAGLAAARALRRAGIDDLRVFELEDQAGGNARGHEIAGIACPLGAHYLPLPGREAREVSEWLHELGLARSEHGGTVWDERHLCHAPQERLLLREGGAGRWIDGLLPLADPGASTLAALRRFAGAVREVQRLGFSQPTLRSRWTPTHAALDAVSFAAWLDANGHADPALRWYLDYCCRDDYGAGSARVSAWAGLHYFASRHGFHAPGEGRDEPLDPVLTWPEGNAWLARRLAAGLDDRLATGAVVERIAPSRHEVALDVLDARGGRTRWIAQHAIVCVPLFVAARLVENAPPVLAQAARAMHYAPWLVSNLHVREPLAQRAGAPAAWDNVLHESPALGYVDARHQLLDPRPGATVLTHYWALGGNSVQEAAGQRRALLDRPWRDWAQAVLDDLAFAHPDLAAKTARIDLMRYGHAMAIPVPGLRGHAALAALAREGEGAQRRLHFAHADLSAQSVFEEAFTRGTLAGEAAARALA
ncbi:FAD-dependent oxidoreductase [Caldimonas sp. KR1-144]|uniref:FAD-dependent oxidoreductase n=1 Tax=Caldimonas sp. KR1-144 TaxID=3400911 RepID=UPI003BFBA025